MGEFDQRQSKRKPFEYRATILLSEQRRVSVAIEDISDGGAKLYTPTAPSLPDRFILELTPRSWVTRACRVAWRSHTHLGVQFTGKAHKLHQPTAALDC